MSGFSKTFLFVFLIWIKKLFNIIWQFLNDPESFFLVKFIINNWQIIAILLILIGVILDWLFYIARWRPYYVWFGRKQKK